MKNDYWKYFLRSGAVIAFTFACIFGYYTIREEASEFILWLVIIVGVISPIFSLIFLFIAIRKAKSEICKAYVKFIIYKRKVWNSYKLNKKIHDRYLIIILLLLFVILCLLFFNSKEPILISKEKDKISINQVDSIKLNVHDTIRRIDSSSIKDNKKVSQETHSKKRVIPYHPNRLSNRAQSGEEVYILIGKYSKQEKKWDKTFVDGLSEIKISEINSLKTIVISKVSFGFDKIPVGNNTDDYVGLIDPSNTPHNVLAVSNKEYSGILYYYAKIIYP